MLDLIRADGSLPSIESALLRIAETHASERSESEEKKSIKSHHT
jgi:hypothetical protein